MQKTSAVGLPVAVWLLSKGGYDLVPEQGLISATTLQSPIRSLVLTARLPEGLVADNDNDITRGISSKIGTAVHSAVEAAWNEPLSEPMRALGYPQYVIDKVRINPDSPNEDSLDVYIEKRTQKKVGNWTVSGKFDFVVDGELNDIKTTKAYGFMKGTSKHEYMLQGSIYKWLNPDIITSNYVRINWVITDWSPHQASSDPAYPQRAALFQDLPILSVEATQTYIENRLDLLDRLMHVPQEELPLCSPAELWQEPPKWAYYANRDSTQRATRVFESEAEAAAKLAEGGFKGIVMKRQGEVRKCNYCTARPICQQAEELSRTGALK